MLLPSRTAALEGVAAVRGQLQGRKLAASLLNPSSVQSALAQTVPNRLQLVPDKFRSLFCLRSAARVAARLPSRRLARTRTVQFFYFKCWFTGRGFSFSNLNQIKRKCQLPLYHTTPYLLLAREACSLLLRRLAAKESRDLEGDTK